MSGSYFNYLYKKHWNGEYETIPSLCGDMSGWLRRTGMIDEAVRVERHGAFVQSHLDALNRACDDAHDFLKAVEWLASGDGNEESVRQALKAYEERRGIIVDNKTEKTEYVFDNEAFRVAISSGAARVDVTNLNVSVNALDRIAEGKADQLTLSDLMTICQAYGLDYNQFLKRRVWRLVQE